MAQPADRYARRRSPPARRSVPTARSATTATATSSTRCSYLTSRSGRTSGRDALGAVVVMDQQSWSARGIQKADARPGGYVQTGAHQRVLGSVTSTGRCVVTHAPAATAYLVLRSSPDAAARGRGPAGLGGVEACQFRSAATDGELLADAIPPVWIAKHGQYREATEEMDPAAEIGLQALLDRARVARLTRWPASCPRAARRTAAGEAGGPALHRFVFSGYPVVRSPGATPAASRRSATGRLRSPAATTPRPRHACC